MKRWFLAAALGVLCVGSVLTAGRAVTVGSFALDQAAPKAGDAISFTVDVKNLPTNGGATISPWVELSCGSVYDDLQASISPVVQGGTNPTRAHFTLSSSAWGVAGFTAQDCEAYLFYDGWNGPRRRKTNTLAALFFSVDAAP